MEVDVFAGSEFKSVRKALDDIPIIDTHEHYGETWSSGGTTLYSIFRESYVGWVAHEDELTDNPASLIEWLEPARDNSYTVSLVRAMRQLYDLGDAELDEALVRALAEKVRTAYQDTSWAPQGRHPAHDR